MMNDSQIRVQATPDPGRQEELKVLISRLGLKPNLELWPRLERALIHRSYRAESRMNEDNERLEFLGDSVISLASTEYLMQKFPESDEGWLSKLRAAMVSRVVLGKIALEMGIGDLIRLGAGEEKSGGRKRTSILGSALEAVCGSIYLSYGWSELREPLRKNIVIPALDLAREEHVVDYKSILQEWTQKHYQKVPAYIVVGEGGPDHKKVFDVEARLAETVLGKGSGNRIKTAENQAAREALDRIQEEDVSA